jgi:hypothetical protein
MWDDFKVTASEIDSYSLGSLCWAEQRYQGCEQLVVKDDKQIGVSDGVVDLGLVQGSSFPVGHLSNLALDDVYVIAYKS